MSEIITMSMILLVILSTLFINVTSYSKTHYYSDCEYVQPSCKTASAGGEATNVDTAACNATDYICCKTSVLPSIDNIRQKSFRALIETTMNISIGCAQRILCEKSCEESWKLKKNIEKSNDLSAFVNDHLRIANLYRKRFGISCYSISSSDFCDRSCQKMYPNCDQDIQNDLLPGHFYISWKVFKNLGAWFFSSAFLTHESYYESKANGHSSYSSVKKSYETLYDRMNKMCMAYVNSMDANGNGRRLSWHDVLKEYKQTDPKLVENVDGSLRYSEYIDVMRSIDIGLGIYSYKLDNETVCDPGEIEDEDWLNNEAICVKYTMILLIISSLYVVF